MHEQIEEEVLGVDRQRDKGLMAAAKMSLNNFGRPPNVARVYIACVQLDTF